MRNPSKKATIAGVHRTLSVYVAGQIVPPFVVSLLAFTLVFLTGHMLRLTELVVSRGAPVGQVASLFALVLPTLLETTLPMAFLLGILHGCGRLSRNGETLAFKACGVGPFHFLVPVALAALPVSLLTLGLSVFVRPAANLALKEEIQAAARVGAGALLKEKVFNDLFPNVLIYVDEVTPPGNAFRGVLIVDRRDETAENLIIGKAALLLSDGEANSIGLRLFDGAVHERGRSGFSQTSFRSYDLRLELDRLLSPQDPGSRRPEEMPLPRLREAIRSKSARGLSAVPEVMEAHRRFAFPAAPLVFALLGTAIVLAPSRPSSGRSRGLLSCLAWLLAYYALLSVGAALGENGKVPPRLAPWLPNLVVGLTAAYLFARTLKETPSPWNARAAGWLRALRRTTAARHGTPAK